MPYVVPRPHNPNAVNAQGLISLQRVAGNSTGAVVDPADSDYGGPTFEDILFSNRATTLYDVAGGYDPVLLQSIYNSLTPSDGPSPQIGAGAPNVLGGVKTAADKAKDIADALLVQIKEFLRFYEQAQLVLNPVTKKATIVFGTPPAGQPVIQAGNLPRSNTNVGVTTGIPILDQAINSVLNKPGGLKDSGSIRQAVIDIIAEQSGLPYAATAAILGKDLETIVATVYADVANTAATVGINFLGEEEDDVVDNVIKNTDTADSIVTDTDTSTDTADSIVTGTGTDDSIVTGTGTDDPYSIVTGADTGDSIVTGTGAGDSTSIVTGTDTGDSIVTGTGAGDSTSKIGRAHV